MRRPYRVVPGRGVNYLSAAQAPGGRSQHMRRPGRVCNPESPPQRDMALPERSGRPSPGAPHG